MKPCDDRWREEVADHVLGSPASIALTEHLASCTICSATLRDWKARMAKVDAGIQQLAASEPAAHAAPRIMAKLQSRRQRAWLPAWTRRTAALCGLVIVLMSTIYVWRVHEQRRESEKVLSAASAIGSWRSPTQSLLRPSSDRWLKTPPQLGRYFYPLNTIVPRRRERTHER